MLKYFALPKLNIWHIEKQPLKGFKCTPLGIKMLCGIYFYFSEGKLQERDFVGLHLRCKKCWGIYIRNENRKKQEMMHAAEEDRVHSRTLGHVDS